MTSPLEISKSTNVLGIKNTRVDGTAANFKQRALSAEEHRVYLCMSDKQLAQIARAASAPDIPLRVPMGERTIMRRSPKLEGRCEVAALRELARREELQHAGLFEVAYVHQPYMPGKETAKDIADISPDYNHDPKEILAVLRAFQKRQYGQQECQDGTALQLHIAQGIEHATLKVPFASLCGLTATKSRSRTRHRTVSVDPSSVLDWSTMLCKPGSGWKSPTAAEMAEAREWVQRVATGPEQASALSRHDAKRSRTPSDSTEEQAAKRPKPDRGQSWSDEWSNNKPVFTVTDVCLSLTGAVSAVSSPSAGLPTHDPKYGSITPEQIEQCVGSLMAKYGPPTPTPAPPQAPELGMTSMESAASAVVALMVGSDAPPHDYPPRMITRATHKMHENEQRAQKRQRARDQRREKTDPYYRSHFVATDLPVDEKPFTQLEGLYVSASTEHSEKAREQAATREERFVSIVHALFLLAEEHGMPGLSVHTAYLTKDPATLRITLGRLIEVSVPQHLRDHARLAIPRVLCASRGAHSFGPRSARQLLETPLREVCGMTTKIPHFHFIRRGVRRDDMSTADVLRKFTANSPQLTRDIVAAAAAATGP